MSQGAVDYTYKWMNDSIHGHIQLDKVPYTPPPPPPVHCQC